MYWYLNKRPRSETRENVYVMTMVSRNPRQIVGFDVARDKSACHIQDIVDNAPEAETYCTDGDYGYLDVGYPGRHIYNVHDKSNTFTVEGVNADLRHYIPVLARRSRCFPRKLETLRAVMDVFVEAYNRFGKEKQRWRAAHDKGEVPFSLLDFF